MQFKVLYLLFLRKPVSSFSNYLPDKRVSSMRRLLLLLVIRDLSFLWVLSRETRLVLLEQMFSNVESFLGSTQIACVSYAKFNAVVNNCYNKDNQLFDLKT